MFFLINMNKNVKEIDKHVNHDFIDRLTVSRNNYNYDNDCYSNSHNNYNKQRKRKSYKVNGDDGGSLLLSAPTGAAITTTTEEIREIEALKIIGNINNTNNNYYNKTKTKINENNNHLYNYRIDGDYRRRLLTWFPFSRSRWSHLSLIIAIIMIIIIIMNRITMALPQGCILCDNDDLKGTKYHEHNYEEFRYEHQVTRNDAIAALRQLNESFYEGSPMDTSCNSIRCTPKLMKYCFSSQFINDHCLCELAHNVEGLPFVPHICYVGEKAHKPSVGSSCFIFEEVKDCCCAPALAAQWRHISNASIINLPYFFYLVFTCINLYYIT